MPLRIGFDLDGVLADMESALVCQAEVVFGEAATLKMRERAAEEAAHGEPGPANAPSVRRLSMSSRQQSRLWRHIESVENFWEGLKDLEPGVVGRLATLASERR